MHIGIYMANRLREVLLNGKWIANTNFKDQISGIGCQTAIRKLGSLNTIAALTFHINYYVAGVLHAIDHGKLEISDKYSFDCPAIESEEDWKKLVAKFVNDAEQLVARVERMDDKTFATVFIDEKYGNYLRNVEAIIEHSYYHLGQVSLIKKMIAQEISESSRDK